MVSQRTVASRGRREAPENACAARTHGLKFRVVGLVEQVAEAGMVMPMTIAGTDGEKLRLAQRSRVATAGEIIRSFKRTAEQALRLDQTIVPQWPNAAPGITGINMLRFGLLFSALSVAIASFAVLALAGVSATVWIVQAMAVIAAAAIALAGRLLGRWYGAPLPVGLILAATLIGIAAPMFSDKPDPERWISLGSLSLYVAPVLLPAFLVACSTCVYHPGASERMALIAIAGVSVLLGLQPDGSQAFALLMGAAVAIARVRERSRLAVVALIVAALATVWAFTRPDPLEPIPYVEGVFELALGYSLLAGVAVIASAAALILSLHLSTSNAGRGLSAVAAYYAVLYACSVAGLTPAPLIGYGAGPWLGFGLAVGAVSWSGRRRDGNL